MLMEHFYETNSGSRKALPAVTMICYCCIKHYAAVLALIKAAELRIFEQLYEVSAGRHARHLKGIPDWLAIRQLAAEVWCE